MVQDNMVKIGWIVRLQYQKFTLLILVFFSDLSSSSSIADLPLGESGCPFFFSLVASYAIENLPFFDLGMGSDEESVSISMTWNLDGA